MDQYEGFFLSGHLEQLRTDLGGFRLQYHTIALVSLYEEYKLS